MDFKWLLVCSCCVRNKGEKNCQKAFSCKNNAIRRLWRKNSAWGISRKLHLMKQAHCGFKWMKPSKIKFTLCDFMNFSKQVPEDSHNFRFRSLHAINTQNLSNCCKHKFYQSISRIFESSYRQIFAIWTNCEAKAVSSLANQGKFGSPCMVV